MINIAWYYAVPLVVVISLIGVVLSNIPYLFINKVKYSDLLTKKKDLKAKSKVLEGEECNNVLKELIKTNMEINKIIFIPLIIQVTVVLTIVKWLFKAQLVSFWWLWYLLSVIFIGKHIKRKMMGLKK